MLQSIAGLLSGWLPALVGILGAVGGLLLLVLGIRKSGSDAQKVKDQEKQLEQNQHVDEKVIDSLDAGKRTADDLRNHPDKLREDDGFRRD